MATPGKSSHRLILLAALILCVGGAFAAFGETRSYLSGGTLPAEHFAALAEGRQLTGLSIPSNRLVLDNCFDALNGVYGRLQPADGRKAVATTCLQQAAQITRSMPSYSYAWYIASLSAAELGDSAGLADNLRQSQATGPSEEWIAELRVNLAEAHLGELPDDIRSHNDSDLAVLAESYRGVSSIAKRYVDDAGFRERITGIVEKLPDDVQRRFIAFVERAAQRTGRSQ
jgi:hypothetical protein